MRPPHAVSRQIAEAALSGYGRGGGTAGNGRDAGIVAPCSTARDPDRLAALGLAYQLRWRETGDPSFLPLSERRSDGALTQRPGDAGRDARARQSSR